MSSMDMLLKPSKVGVSIQYSGLSQLESIELISTIFFKDLNQLGTTDLYDLGQVFFNIMLL